jgi:hypothetical protein
VTTSATSGGGTDTVRIIRIKGGLRLKGRVRLR